MNILQVLKISDPIVASAAYSNNEIASAIPEQDVGHRNLQESFKQR